MIRLKNNINVALLKDISHILKAVHVDILDLDDLRFSIIHEKSILIPRLGMVGIQSLCGERFLLVDSFNWGHAEHNANGAGPTFNFLEPEGKDFECSDFMEIDGLCVSLASPWSGSFFHWCEELAKAVWLESKGFRPVYLVPGNASLYVDSLLYLGIDQGRIVPLTATPVVFNNFIATPQIRLQDLKCLPAILELRNHVRNLTNIDPTANPYCFILRSSRHLMFSERAIANLEEVSNFCAYHEIDLVDPNAWSFSDQIRLLRSRSIISGVHGAGLTHQLWAETGSCVIDATSPKYINPVFGALASRLDHYYFLLVQTYLESSGMTCDPKNVFVPVDQLEWAFKAATKLAWRGRG